jgi:hypothetical protein
MNLRPPGRADLEIGAPIGPAGRRVELARPKTCKTLLQVKQSFVIHLKFLAAWR